MSGDGGAEATMMSHGVILNSDFTGKNKASRVQVGRFYNTQTKKWDAAWAPVYSGSWCCVGRPAEADLDADGQVKGACEAMVTQDEDGITCLGQRDVRWNMFTQDLKPGEAVFFNAMGSRLLLSKASVSLIAVGGAHINFDIVHKKASFVGFTNTAKQASRITLGLSAVGIVSPNGANSINVSDSSITISGKGGVTIRSGKVILGLVGSDPVVTLSKLSALVTQLLIQFAAHVHGAPGTPPTIAMMLVPTGSSTVLASP